MQLATAPPRDALTAAEVEEAIVGDDPTIDAGCELLNANDSLVEDISADFDPTGSFVDHGNYQTVHTSFVLRIARRLEWGSARLRPYMTINGIRFNLGVGIPSIPAEPVGDDEEWFQVECTDKGILLDQPIGETWRISIDSGYLFNVQHILTLLGISAQVVDQSSIDKRTPQALTWPVSEQNTWRRVLTDLLSAINYRPVWFDWDGAARVEPYQSPADRSPEWTYDALADDTILAASRMETADYTDAPNHWVFARNDPLQGLPVDGNGLYVVTNQSDGATSIDARGRTITARPCPIFIDAADHDSLVARAAQQVDRDKRIYRDFKFATEPNPLHWHFDVCQMIDEDTGLDMKCVWRSWRLPLDGSPMSHEARQT